MIGAPNTQSQKYRVGIVQWAPETSVSEEIADIFRNYNIDSLDYVKMQNLYLPRISVGTVLFVYFKYIPYAFEMTFDNLPRFNIRQLFKGRWDHHFIPAHQAFQFTLYGTLHYWL